MPSSSCAPQGSHSFLCVPQTRILCELTVCYSRVSQTLPGRITWGLVKNVRHFFS